MKAFAVEHPLHKPGMSIFHYMLFHGRQTSGFPHWRSGIPFFGDQEKRPLRITHNVRRIPDVFSPVSSLVVSAHVRDMLGALPFVEYRAVGFPELIDVEVAPLGDLSWENNPAVQKAARSKEWPRNLFEHLPQASTEQHAQVGSYYEMVVPRLKEAAAEFPDARPLRIPRRHGIDKQNELRICPAMLEKYPVVWWSQVVFVEPIFRKIEPFLDPAYAEVVEFEVQ